jgi:hypothetical protein
MDTRAIAHLKNWKILATGYRRPRKKLSSASPQSPAFLMTVRLLYPDRGIALCRSFCGAARAIALSITFHYL